MGEGGACKKLLLGSGKLWCLSLSSVHTQVLALEYSRKTDWKTKGLVSRNSESYIPRSGFF